MPPTDPPPASVHRSPHPFRAFRATAPADWPERYAMIVAGTCMAPETPDGTLLVFDRMAPVRAGDLVALHFRPELMKPGRSPVAVKRIVVPPPPGFGLPWHDRAGANVRPVTIIEQTNQRATITIFLSDLVAIHRCLGPAAGAAFTVS